MEPPEHVDAALRLLWPRSHHRWNQERPSCCRCRQMRRPTAGAPVWGELLDLAVAMADLADRATTAEGMPALHDLVNLTVERVPSARWASLTVLRAKKFRTEAATHPGATKADVLQYEMGFGPCVDAVRDDSVYVSDDVAGDERWPKWGARVHAELGVRSVLSQRLRLSGDFGVIAALNIYSHAADAFDEHARAVGLVLATHGGLLMNTLLASDRARNLKRALETNREIGVAIGVLMHRTPTQPDAGVRRPARGQPGLQPQARGHRQPRSSTPAP